LKVFMALDPITAGLGFFTTLIDKIFPDKSAEEKQRIAQQMAIAAQEYELAKAQVVLNTSEASNTNLFVSGWRPFIGWVCGLAFSWQYFLAPLISYLIVLSGHAAPPLPTLGMDQMMPVLMGILGLGAYRSYEKVKGVGK
jgi:hypothetical protein